MARKTKPKTRRGSIIIISAPSGSGKSTLVKRLLASVPHLVFSVSHTTRPRRDGEKDGRDYFFVSPARFRRMVAARAFAEWADVFGNLYGTSWKQVRAAQAAGKDVLLDIDVQGHQQVRRRLPEAVSVFVLPPSYQELERRLRRRHSDAPEVITRRLKAARKEMLRWKEYDYLVVNDHLENATQALMWVVKAAGFRRPIQQERARNIQGTFGGKIG
ncbi:MAG TPA: guanylate kinase [Terriglobia bacterium]|nr:guanylate kinase [Terriglobia bacterium]